MARIILGLLIALATTAGCGGDSTGNTDAGPGDGDGMVPSGVCGNGEVEAGETCDDGNQSDGDACPATCAVAQCGDGIAAPGELCLPYARPLVNRSLSSMVVGDFDGDGHQDIAGLDSGIVVILYGDGTGAGASGPEVTLADVEVNELAAGDFDGNGDADLAFVGTRTTTDANGNAIVEDGLGFIQQDGSFLFTPIDGIGTQAAAADVDRDGDDDLVTGGNGFATRLHLVTFPDTVTVEVSDAADARALALENVTGNPAAELVVATGGQILLFAYEDNAFVQKHAADREIVPPVNSIHAGDIDGNGLTDIVVYGDGAAAVLAQAETGFPAAADPAAQIAAVSGAAILLIDADSDGDLDLVAAGGQNRDVVALLNDGGELAGERLGSLPLSGVVAGDFDEDGHVDLVGRHVGGGLAIVSTATLGKLAFPARFDVPGGAHGVAVGEVTGDAYLDVVVTIFEADETNGDFSAIAVLEGLGDGRFAEPHTLADGTCAFPFDLALADVDGSGVKDIVAVCSNDGRVAVYLSADGAWDRQPDIALGSTGWAAVAGDVNADGRPDLAVTHVTDEAVSILLSDGDELVRTATINVSGWPSAVDLGDIDGDGDLDLLVGQLVGESVAVFANATGRGDFVSAGSYAVSGRPMALAVADVNGDDQADIAVSNQGYDDVPHATTVLLNVGSGFADPVSYEGAEDPFGLAVADLDNQDTAGLVVAARAADRLHVMVLDDLGLTARQEFAVENRPHEVVAADVNGDRALDLITTYELGRSVTIGLSNP